MTRSVFSKVAWVGRTASMVFGLALVLALIFGVATTAMGANGNPFLLGQSNLATAITKLTGNTNGSAMQVTNSNAGADDTALDLRVQAGEAPMRVNSGTRVANLNAQFAGRADSAAQADTATSAQDTDKLDGKDSSEFARAYKRTIVVGPVPGDPAASGTALTNALSGITGASEGNPYLLKLEPGVYDLGTGTLRMKSFVDVEGSGEQVTKIRSSGPAGADHNTLTGASNAGLRFLTVENTGGGDYATAIRNDFASPTITHVTARASGGVRGSRGIINASSSPKISETTVVATGASGSKLGIGVYNSTLTIENTDITVTGAGGEKLGIESNDGAGGDDYLTLANVNVSVSEGSGDHYGIKTFDYQTRATDARITVSGSGSNYGVHTRDGVGGLDLLTLQGFKVSVSGGTSNIGIHNGDTNMEIGNSRIEADGGTSIGVRAAEPGVGGWDEVRIDNSVVRGATNTVQGTGGANVKIGASRLHGGPASGVNACAGVYDENYAFSASTCP